MKKKIFSVLTVILGFIILFVIGFFIYLNQDESYERTGAYFDSSGKQLGTCKQVTLYKKLASTPYSVKSYFYSKDNEEIGNCENKPFGCNIKSSVIGSEARYECALKEN